MSDKVFWKPEQGEGEAYENYFLVAVREEPDGPKIYRHIETNLTPASGLILALEVLARAVDILHEIIDKYIAKRGPEERPWDERR